MNILCICLGNSDRSPVIRGLLELMLRNQGRNEVVVESAGVLDSAKSGEGAPALAIAIAPTYGIDLTNHRKRHLSTVDLATINFVVAADKETMAHLIESGVKQEIICLELDGAKNAWKSQNPHKLEAMFWAISDALYREVISYKFRM